MLICRRINSFLTLSLFLISFTSWGTDFIWNGTISSSWANYQNWTVTAGGTGIATAILYPGADPLRSDNVVIDAGTNIPLLDAARSLNNFTLNNNKSLNLNGFTLNIGGSPAFNSGTITSSIAGAQLISTNGAATVTLGSGASTPLTIGSLTYNIAVNLQGALVQVNGGLTMHGNLQLEKTGSNTNLNNWVSGNTFNGPVTIKLSSNSSGLQTAATGTGTDNFNSTLDIINTGSMLLNIGSSTATITNITGNVKINGSGTGAIGIGYSSLGNVTPNNGTVNFKGGTIEIKNSSSGGIYFGGSTNPSPVSAPVITISSPGYMYIPGPFGTNFTAGNLYLRNIIQSEGGLGNDLNLNANAGTLTILNSTLNSGGDFGAGTLNITNSNFKNNAFFKKYERSVASNNTHDYLGDNVFNGAAFFTNYVPNYFLYTGNNNSRGETFNAEVFFTAQVGPIVPSYKGTTSYNGNIYVRSTNPTGVLFSSGGTGNSVLASGKTITVEGGASYFSSGDLSFRNFTQSGTTAQNIELSGTAKLYFYPGTTFNGSLTATASDIYFNGATFNGGTFTKTSANLVECTGGNTFNGNVKFYLASTASNTWTISKTTKDSYSSTGTAEFYNESVNTSGIILLATGPSAASSFNGNLFLENRGAGKILVAQTATLVSTIGTAGGTNKLKIVHGNSSSGTIEIGKADIYADLEMISAGVSTTTAREIKLGNANSGLATLKNGKFFIVDKLTFTTGTISFQNFKQEGTTGGLTGKTLEITGASKIQIFAGTIFEAPYKSISPQISITGGTFSNTADITRNGSSADIWTGTVLFSNTSKFYNSGTGDLQFGNSPATTFTFKGAAEFYKQSAANLYTAAYGNHNFEGNLTYNSTTGNPSDFGTLGGVVFFNGTTDQSIITAHLNLSFNSITVNKNSGKLYLNSNITLLKGANGTLTLTKGIIVGSATRVVNFGDDATVTGASTASFVDGPVIKTGNDAFTFPVGKGTKYAPVSMSASALNTDAYQVEYFNSAPTGASITGALKDYSNCEYWNTSRTAGTNNVTITLPWTSGGCTPINSETMLVARYNGTNWISEGGNVTGTDAAGSVTSGILTGYGQITYGYKTLIILDLTSVNETAFNVTTGTEPVATVTYYSGPTRNYPGTNTKVSSLFNIAGNLVLHPDSPSSTIDIAISGTTAYESLDIRLTTDATFNISSVKAKVDGVYSDLAPSLYTVSSYNGINSKIAFRKQPVESTSLAITTNLPDGLTFNITDLGNFSITIPGAGFTSYALRVYKSDNTLVYNRTFMNSPVTWDGKDSVTQNSVLDGTYRFELDIVSGTTTKTLNGQIFVIKK